MGRSSSSRRGGGASFGERREAELFFQELLGAPLPSGAWAPRQRAPKQRAEAATPAAIFDAVVLGTRTLAPELAERIAVVARPGEPLAGRVRPGDRLLWRALGEGNLAHESVLEDAIDGRLGRDQLVIRDRGEDHADPFEHWGETLTFSATRFQGNARLEDALNGRRNIQKPLVDPSVAIVQQALVDLGYPLPKHGVDGKFGSETKTEVERFQREQKTRDPAFEVDGIVGPQTMGRLDAIFAVLDRPCSAPTTAAADPSALVVAQPGTIPYSVVAPVVIDGVTVEVRGTIFYPADTAGSAQPFATGVGPAPVVFIAHGNHDKFHDPADRNNESCTQHPGWIRIASHDGYPYLQEMLARLGIVSVSVDCHDSNCRGFTAGNMRLRAKTIVESIRHVMSLNTKGSGSVLEEHIDFARTGLLGHSRGGEAVVVTPDEITAAGAPVDAARVVGIISLAPTDRGGFAAPAGIPYMAILPAGDGDVITNAGAQIYDRFRPAPFKTQLYIHRTNHNRFNREWPVDDLLSGAAPIPRADHERILEVYTAAFFREVALGQTMRPILSGAEVVAGLPNDQIFVSHQVDTFTTVDDHEVVPPPPAVPIETNSLGNTTTQAGTLTADEAELRMASPPTSPTGNYPGRTRAMHAICTTAYGTFRSPLSGSVSLTNREVWIRAAESYDGASVPVGATRFQIGVEDDKGRIAFVASGDLARPFDRRTEDIANFGEDFTKTMFQTIRIPQSCLTLARPGVDMTKIRALVIRMHGPAGRRMVFDDLQLSP